MPNERLFNVGDPELLKLYGPVTRLGALAHPDAPVDQGEIFVGIGQLVLDALGTANIPQVRAYMAELIAVCANAEGLRAGGENGWRRPPRDGVLAPEVNMLTAGRLHSIEQYPRIIHTLQELCGQGLVMRFQKADFDNTEIGPLLDELLPGNGHDARATRTGS